LQKCSKCDITPITNVQQSNAQNLKAQKMKSSLAVTTAVRWHPVNLASLIRKQNCAQVGSCFKHYALKIVPVAFLLIDNVEWCWLGGAELSLIVINFFSTECHQTFDSKHHFWIKIIFSLVFLVWAACPTMTNDMHKYTGHPDKHNLTTFYSCQQGGQMRSTSVTQQ